MVSKAAAIYIGMICYKRHVKCLGNDQMLILAPFVML